MTKKLFAFFLLISATLNAQVPTGYYDSATGDGYTLKTQLKNIIKNGHTNQGYDALYNAYKKTDNDSFYENDNSVLDMYSENPTDTDPYNYQHNGRKCGNYSSENNCYNREHIFPQGFFNKKQPMRSDIHFVIPSDGYVNGRRSNYPFGEVSNPSWTSMNGSKVGQNTFPGHVGNVFEPIDEFKGDIARMLFYFAVRYEDDVTSSGWDAPNASNNNPLNGTNNQVYESWYIKLLYKWHTNDPVNNREIVRNNEAYTFQGNRNPFIDNPDYVLSIWGNVLSTKTVNSIKNVAVYPNPTSTKRIVIQTPPNIQVDKVTIYSILGKEVYKNEKPKFRNNKLRIKNLKSGMYLLKIENKKESVTKKLIVN